MKTTLQHVLKLTFLSIALSWSMAGMAYSQSVIPMPPSAAVTKPPFPIAQMKTLRVTAEALKNFLDEGDYWAFYKNADLLLDKYTNPDGVFFTRFNSEEAAVMYLWLSYFIATTPFLTYEAHGNPGGENVWNDMDIKKVSVNTNALLTSTITSALKTKQTECQPLLLEYTRYTMDSFRLGLETANQVKEEIKAVREHPTGELIQKYAPYNVASDGDPYDGLQNLSAFWSLVKTSLESALSISTEAQAAQIIAASSKSGTQLHSLLARAGYKDKDSRHRILLKIAGRDKNTEWMYVGIPKSETKKLQEAYLLKKNAKPPAKKQEATKQEPKKTEPKK
jgi:hypothetical protein